MSRIFGDLVLGDSDSPTSATAGNVNDWASYTPSPTTSSPPLVAASTDTNSSNSAGTAVASLATGLVNIFGKSLSQANTVPLMPVQPTPLWVFALLGVGGVVVLGVVARSLRKKKSSRVSGYRKHRKHRRSRR